MCARVSGPPLQDLKKLYSLLGKGEVVFLFTDAHVVEEGFLEFINNMLTTGMVPALFEQASHTRSIASPAGRHWADTDPGVLM